MIVADFMFDEFFSKPLPGEGFEIDPNGMTYPGLIAEPTFEKRELHGYEVTMNGEVVVPELRPKNDMQKG